MNLEEVRSIVAAGESEQVEFKRTTGQRSEAVRTVCAMLNGIGGFVLFDITDAGVVAGQEVATRTLEELANEVHRIEPPVFPDIETVPLEHGRAVIAIRVPGGSGPYTYDGRPYVRYGRYGPTTRVMPRERYERLSCCARTRHARGIRWWPTCFTAGAIIESWGAARSRWRSWPTMRGWPRR